MTDELRRACARALHAVRPDGEILKAGRGTLLVLSEIGWERTARIFSRRPLVWAVELGYWFVARNRSWLGKILPSE
ncbi:MAG: hypothetical protein R3234_03970 [Thermoanaerobaculia bacterium]|nr:hypothetical protein [Thermoanaerobaculia bacterium]